MPELLVALDFDGDALVGDDDLGALLDLDLIGLEVPVGVRGAVAGLFEKVLQCGSESQGRQGDILAKVGTQTGVGVCGRWMGSLLKDSGSHSSKATI
jgi:hypothetical protein